MSPLELPPALMQQLHPHQLATHVLHPYDKPFLRSTAKRKTTSPLDALVAPLVPALIPQTLLRHGRLHPLPPPTVKDPSPRPGLPERRTLRRLPASPRKRRVPTTPTAGAGSRGGNFELLLSTRQVCNLLYFSLCM